MTPAIAVALVHGIGDQQADFAGAMMRKLSEAAGREARARGAETPTIVQEAVHWSPVVQPRQVEVWRRVHRNASLNDALGLREFLVSYASDVVAYQPTPSSSHVYDAVHAVFAATLKRLAAKAGPDAPLVVIGHSLGTVIASNYLYDLQAEYGPYRRAGPGPMAPALREALRDATPLERGETLAQLYTMGSPLALWGVRAHSADPRFDYGAPVRVPAPALATRLPEVAASREAVGWINFYDRDDILAFPLRELNDAHREGVKEDRQVNVGGLLTSRSPLSHQKYWTDDDVTDAIGRSLAAAWVAMHSRRVPVAAPAPAESVRP